MPLFSKKIAHPVLNPIQMNNNLKLLISPIQVPVNASLTIRTYDDYFPDNGYMITDELGRIIRKGAIAKGICEFSLSMVGLATGVYRITMGQVQERFTIL